MRTFTTTSRLTGSTLAVVAALTLTAACSGGDGADSDGGGAGASASSDPAAELVGPACAEYAKAVPDGAGSVGGMALDPLAVAAGNNPLLTTLTAAISGQLNPDVNLVDTLNNDEFTVFAPVDDAFNKLDPKQVDKLAKPKNAGRLTDLLTYHVIAGRIAPDDIDGEQETVNGAPLTVSGSGDDLVVNEGTDAAANVICGGVQTANATVYLVDTVLDPKAGPSGDGGGA